MPQTLPVGPDGDVLNGIGTGNEWYMAELEDEQRSEPEGSIK